MNARTVAFFLSLALGCGGGAASEPEHRAPPGDEQPPERTSVEPAPSPPAPEPPPPRALRVDEAPPPAAFRSADLAPEAVEAARLDFEAGIAAYGENDFATAARHLEAAYARVPEPQIAFNLGYCYDRMGDPARAVAHYRHYLDSDGTLSPAQRASIEERIARMDAYAARLRDQTMALPPTAEAIREDAGVLFEQGQAMFARRRYPAAYQAFSAAAAAFQARGVEVPELLYNLAVTSERMRQLDDAAEYLEEYLRLRPTDPEADAMRARIATFRGRTR